MLNHLRKCSYQPERVRDDAEAAAQIRKQQNMGPPTIILPIPIIQDGTTGHLLPVNIAQGLQPHMNTLLPLSFTSRQTTPSGSASSGISSRGSSRANSPHPDGLFRRQSGSRSSSVAPYSANQEWSADRQTTFETRLGRLTASTGSALSWIENPEFILFCQEFVHPCAIVPSRKKLTHRILPGVRREFRKKAQAAIKEGSKATVQADGWSGINDHHLNAFMMTVGQKVREKTSTSRSKNNNLEDPYLTCPRLFRRTQDSG